MCLDFFTFILRSQTFHETKRHYRQATAVIVARTYNQTRGSITIKAESLDFGEWEWKHSRWE